MARINYTIAVITLFFFHLGYYTVTSTFNNINGGFSAHLIRKNAPKLPLHKQRSNKVSRRLIAPDVPEAPMTVDPLSYEQIMKFSMGTPPVDIHATADTGSDLVWTQCEPCKVCHKTKFGIFDPRNSSSHKNITCRSSDCRLLGKNYVPSLQALCKSAPTANCVYAYAYLDHSYSFGELGKETISLKSTTGNVVTLKDIIFGCATTNKKPINSENDMGIIGLGRGPLSFVSQIGPYVGGKRFSHCLVNDVNSESKIYFGNGSEVLGEGVVTIPLVDDKTKYSVTVSGISIGDDFLPFYSNGTLLRKDNMIVDSGTPLTLLPQDLFNRVVTKLQKEVPLESFIWKANGLESLCFNTTTPPKLPRIAVHFESGGEVPLSDAALSEQDGGINCVSFSPFPGESSSPFPGDTGIFGGLFQRDLLIGFDLEKNEVSFKPTDCKDYNKNN